MSTRRGFLGALLPLSLSGQTVDFTRPTNTVKAIEPDVIFRCPVHGPLHSGMGWTIPEGFTLRRTVQGSEKAEDFGPICVFCAVEHIKAVCPPLEKP